MILWELSTCQLSGIAMILPYPPCLLLPPTSYNTVLSKSAEQMPGHYIRPDPEETLEAGSHRVLGLILGEDTTLYVSISSQAYCYSA